MLEYFFLISVSESWGEVKGVWVFVLKPNSERNRKYECEKKAVADVLTSELKTASSFPYVRSRFIHGFGSLLGRAGSVVGSSAGKVEGFSYHNSSLFIWKPNDLGFIYDLLRDDD